VARPAPREFKSKRKARRYQARENRKASTLTFVLKKVRGGFSVFGRRKPHRRR